MWSAADITIIVHNDMTDDPVVTAEIVTPEGTIWVMAEVRIEERRMMLLDLHTHGEGIGSAAGASRHGGD